MRAVTNDNVNLNDNRLGQVKAEGRGMRYEV